MKDGYLKTALACKKRKYILLFIMKDWRDNPKFKFTEQEKRKARLEEKKSDHKLRLIFFGIFFICLLVYNKYFR